MRSQSLFILVLLLVAAGGLTLWIGSGAPTSRSEEPGKEPQGEVVGHRQGEWIEHLESGNPVRFESKTSEEPTEVVPKEPPLSESAKIHLLSLYSSLEASSKLELASFRDGMDTTSELDLLREASLMQQVEKASAVLRAIHSGEYVLLDPESSFPRQIKDGLVVFNNMVEHNGETVDAVFFLRHERNPALAEAAKHGKVVAEYWQKTSVDRFNSLPLPERMRKIQEHKAAEAALRKGPPEGLKPGWEVQQWKQQFYDKMLPDFFVVDKDTYLASLQSQ